MPSKDRPSYAKRAEYMRTSRIRINRDRPWFNTYRAVYSRCRVAGNHKFKWYGGRGIELRMTSDDFKTLWMRDKAYLMKEPSIDRMDSNGHYELSNCRYIELKKNIGRNNKEKTHCPRGHEYSGHNLLVTKQGYRHCRECKNLRRRMKAIARTEGDVCLKK
jgi:hypothetical protein